MKSTVRTFETANNTYYIGYRRECKTSYKQQQEQKKETIYMIKQKAIGIALIIVGVIGSLITQEGSVFIIATLTSLPVVLTKNHVIV